jgi:phosphoribosyl-ATP pyrophosphohydrolase / phosphoribosyl-AMP cyclohydrolase / histidinol dehydrogenase
MVFPTFLPRLTSPTSPALLSALTRIGPILIPRSGYPEVQVALAGLPFGSLADVWVDVSDSTDVDDVDGATTVILNESQVGGATARERSEVLLRVSNVKDLNHDLLDKVSGLIIDASEQLTKDDIAKLRRRLPSPGLIFLSVSSSTEPTIESIRSAYSSQTPLIISTSSLSLPNDISSKTSLELVSAFLSPLISDRTDGLFPTMVTQHTSHASLGLVYSSLESLAETIISGKGVYQSRKQIGKSLWRKGETSGSTQQVFRVRLDCDADAVEVEVEQKGSGFCHLGTKSCFSINARNEEGNLRGIGLLEETLKERLPPNQAPQGSYTARLLSDEKLLTAKILEEASELTEATTKSEIAFEMADVIYFGLVKCLKNGVGWADVERALDEKAEKGRKGIRRTGDAKEKWLKVVESKQGERETKKESTGDAPVPKSFPVEEETKTEESSSSSNGPGIRMRTSKLSGLNAMEHSALLRRPVMDSSAMIAKVQPIIDRVRSGGDEALRSLTAQFDRVQLEKNVIFPPFYQSEARSKDEELPQDVIDAINQAYANIKMFHDAQNEKKPLVVETMPGVVCTRFARPIDRVGIYVPGGTAILPSTALMLGIPAQVAGCKTIVLATPPRKDGTISPEVLYVADLVGASVILKAGGAQAVAAMAYGTEQVPKVDKIFGPGNQWVTAAKMVVQNDTNALVGIDMPAGPSEVMVSRIDTLHQRRHGNSPLIGNPTRLLPITPRIPSSSHLTSYPKRNTASTLKSSSLPSISPSPCFAKSRWKLTSRPMLFLVLTSSSRPLQSHSL